MKTKTHSIKFLRKRKFFLVLPLLVLPFITLMFWALGGRKVSGAEAQQQAVKKGLNLELPDAYLKEDKPLDKLSYYEKAASDSARLEELMKNEPYYSQQRNESKKGLLKDGDTAMLSSNHNHLTSNESAPLTSFNGNRTYTDPNEAKVYKKLDELNIALNRATVQPYKASSSL